MSFDDRWDVDDRFLEAPAHFREVCLEINANPPKGDLARCATLNYDGLKYLVFLPDGLPVDQVGRFSLQAAARRDSKGKQLYVATPIPTRLVQRMWTSVGHQLLLVDAEVDFLGEIKQIPVVHEQREAETRLSEPHLSTDHKVKWGKNLAESEIQVATVERRSVEREAVDPISGNIHWQRLSDQVTLRPAQTCPLVRVNPPTNDTWLKGRCALEQPAQLWLELWLDYRPAGRLAKLKLDSFWGAIPSWLKQQLLADLPVCRCGRRRYLKKDGNCVICTADKAAARGQRIAERNKHW